MSAMQSPADLPEAQKPPVRAEVIEAPPVPKPPRKTPSKEAPPAPRSWLPDDEILKTGIEPLDRARAIVLYCWQCLLGAVTLIIGLAVLATIPVFNLLSLGYLLEVSGRIARTGKFSEGFIGVRRAYRVGSLVLGTYLMLLPLYLISDVWYSSSLIDAKSSITLGWRIGLIVATMIMVVHILLAWYAGGKLRDFFWPFLLPWDLLIGVIVWQTRKEVVHRWWPPPILLIQGLRRGDMYTASRDAVWDFITGLRLPYYFWLGLRGFAGALVWLALPVFVLVVGANVNEGAAALLGFVGSMMLAAVVLYLPFMQAHFAAENRFAAMFEWWNVRMQFRRAPLAFLIALAVALLLALPLYLLKIVATPAEVTWIPAVVFVLFILPARLLAGYALGRARKREQPRFVLSRWGARFASVPVVLTYVLFVYVSQYLTFYGAYTFLDQHAFLVPVPFLGV